MLHNPFVHSLPKQKYLLNFSNILRKQIFTGNQQNNYCSEVNKQKDFAPPQLKSRKRISTRPKIVVLGVSQAVNYAQQVAKQLRLKFIESKEQIPENRITYVLSLKNQKIYLERYEYLTNEYGIGKMVKTHFWVPRFSEQLRDYPKGSPLYRSVEPENGKTVLDATSGFGVDAFALASAGMKVSLIERSPIIHKMLSQALFTARKTTDENLKEILDRIYLFPCTDALNIFSQLKYDENSENLRFDVILLDPMNYSKGNTLPLGKLINNPPPELIANCSANEQRSLLQEALSLAKERVVFKKPYFAGDFGLKPNKTFKSAGAWFDTYLVNKE